MTIEELMFFDHTPAMLPIYTKLKELLNERYPDGYAIKVSKTQISFKNRTIFAMVSLPQRRKKEWPREYLMVSFGLQYEKKSPRIVQAVEPYPNRWTHHVITQSPEDIDNELMNWIHEAYQFSAIK